LEAILPEVRRFLNAVSSWNQPANAVDIGSKEGAVVRLVNSYPQKASEPATYTRALCETVASLGPSRLALDIGLRRIRDTCKFLPAPAEVRESVKGAMRSTSAAIADLEALPERAARYRHELEAFRTAWEGLLSTVNAAESKTP
jgi:hypothetical protein